MVRTLEAIFRRPMRLLALFVLLPLISIAIVYFVVPHTYQTTATLWALRRYEIISATGINTNSDVLTTPAQTQATALSELLQTRTFVLAVARGTDLASTLNPGVRANAQLRDIALFQELSVHVQVQTQGDNLFVITYANHNPQVAQQVVAAVIHNYGLEIQYISAVGSQTLLSGYQTQLAKAEKDVQTAVAAQSQYIQAHPNLTGNDLITDPRYTLLQAQTQQAQLTVQNIQNQIATIGQEISAQGTSPASLFKVLDAPAVASLPESRSRDYFIAGGIGLCSAIIACALYIVILVRRDHAIYAAPDLQRVMAYPVIMQVPRLASKTVLVLLERSR